MRARDGHFKRRRDGAPPGEDYGSGERLSLPFGEDFTAFAHFRTAQNPFNAADTHVTSSDLAFWGDLAYVGDYGGFRIFDISRPKPQLVADERCYGPQGDPSVFDTNRDGDADTLVLSVDSVLAGPECGAAPVSKNVPDGQGGLRYPDGAWEGIRIFDVSDPSDRSRSRPCTRTAGPTRTRCSPPRAAGPSTC